MFLFRRFSIEIFLNANYHGPTFSNKKNGVEDVLRLDRVEAEIIRLLQKDGRLPTLGTSASYRRVGADHSQETLATAQ
jgi:hypothetical protein